MHDRKLDYESRKGSTTPRWLWHVLIATAGVVALCLLVWFAFFAMRAGDQPNRILQ